MLLNIARSSAPPGLLVTLDDLHWADGPTLQLLVHLIRRIALAPLLVVGTYRTVDVDRDHPLTDVLAELSREQMYQRVTLPPLTRDDMAALVTSLGGIAPAPAVVDAIYHQTSGNPFFAGEVVRHLQEQRRDLSDPSAVAEKWDVPEGVHRVIGKRLARLTIDANLLLQASAVVGEPFTFDLLEAMLDSETARLLDALEEALRSGLVREDGPRYHFSHALVRQTLYDGLTLPRRQRLHHRAAAAIERLYARNLGPHLGELAVHYRLAGSATDIARAIHYSEQAGESAIAFLAYEEAAAHWQAALELMPDGDTAHRARLLERLGDLLFVAGLDYGQGISDMEQALNLCESLGLDAESAQVHARLGRALSSLPETWDIPRALRHFRAAQAVLAQTSETSALGYVYAGLAQAAIWDVHIEDGLASSLAAMDLAERIHDDALWAHAAVIHGGHLCSSGRLAAGQELMERAWLSAHRRNYSLTFFASFLGSAYASWLGDQPRAQAWCERELAQRRLGQAPGQRRRFLSRLASHYALGGDLTRARDLLAEVGPSYDTWQVLFWSGDWEQCESIARERVDASGRGGDRAFAFEATYYLAHLSRVRGDGPAALPALERVLDIPVDGGELAYELAARALLTLVCAEVGRQRDAERHLVRARQIMANGEDWHALAAWASLAEGVVSAAGGRVLEAGRRFQHAIERFRGCRVPWGEAEALYVWGQALQAAGDISAASEKFGGATDMYSRHGAGERWVARVRSAQHLPAGLSQRELEVLRLIAAGRTNHQIASELSISVNTAMRHVSNIFAKTGVANRAEAASYGHRHGLT